MSTALQFDTHEIFNQSPPYEDIDLFSTDVPLVEAVKANGAEAEIAALSAFPATARMISTRGFSARSVPVMALLRLST